MRDTPGSYALLSSEERKDTAIVFVHGLRGHPVITWLEFQTLIDTLADEYPWYRSCDLFFYTYSNVGTHLLDNAQRCLAFIRGIFPRPQRELFKFEELSPALSEARIFLLPGEYKELVLVGHSIGGLLLRAAMWDAFKGAYDPSMVVQGQQFPDQKFDDSLLEKDCILAADLCLFAPAHLGISASGWLGSLIHVVASILLDGSALVDTLGFVAPTAVSLLDLDQILAEIRKYTEEHSEKCPTIPALRARVLWGGGEWVVKAWQYKWDKPVEFVRNVGHSA